MTQLVEDLVICQRRLPRTIDEVSAVAIRHLMEIVATFLGRGDAAIVAQLDHATSLFLHLSLNRHLVILVWINTAAGKLKVVVPLSVNDGDFAGTIECDDSDGMPIDLGHI